MRTSLLIRRPEPQHGAFTLIEMLVVITIIALLLALGVPQVVGTLRSSRLTGAGDKVLGTLSEAQQIAYSQNYTVEVRFYKLRAELGNTNSYRKIQMFKVLNTPGANSETITKIGLGVRLPEGVVISAGGTLSPLLDGSTQPDSNGDAGVEGADYVAVRFLTDGTFRKVTNNSANNLAVMTFPAMQDSYMTVVEEDGKTETMNTAPPNFYTVQIDPYTGKSRAYRPGIL